MWTAATTSWDSDRVAAGAEISDVVSRIRRFQTLTIIWMTAEAALSLWAAWRARSPALLAFGGDSAIELFSASVVLWRFRDHSAGQKSERQAARVAGLLLVLLAIYVTAVSIAALLGYAEHSRSYAGIAILIAATLVMPWLARQKRRLSAATGSAALRADAAESMLCAYLSFIALIGLAAAAFFHISWPDPVAALASTPLIIWEAGEALKGRACGCH
jgi:divalent metal cation (Fe/Co/Zn/Cd) transporter